MSSMEDRDEQTYLDGFTTRYEGDTEMATKKELKEEIESLKSTIAEMRFNARSPHLSEIKLWARGIKAGRRQVLDEVYGDRAPGRDVNEAYKRHLNSSYGKVAREHSGFMGFYHDA